MTVDEDEMQQRQRSKEINTLVESINELAVLFKDLNSLVVEQGTILDRIDYNIDTAHINTKEANVHLEKTVQLEKSTRARGVIVCLMVSIIVCTLLLVI